MARQRTSPYLSGVRSRLWRFIAADPSAAGAERDGAPADDAPADHAPASAPVVALIRRLPLLFDE
jgi:hypothetical protein